MTTENTANEQNPQDLYLCVFLDRPLTKAESYEVLKYNKAWIEVVVKMDPTDILDYEDMSDFNTACDVLVFGENTVLSIGNRHGLGYEFIGFSDGKNLVKVYGDLPPDLLLEEFEGEFDVSWIEEIERRTQAKH